MPIRIVQLGSPRARDEGPRLGTVRRPPRGVPKAQFATLDYYDTWLPLLAPSAELMTQGRAAATPAEWARFVRGYRKEMSESAPDQLLGLLATLSQHANFAVGCYCENEAHCHRSVLRSLLQEHGAKIA
jgi:uncharacterized protein YeaO (DUF488 family)